VVQATLLVGDSETNSNLLYKTHFLAGDSFVYVECEARALLVVSPMESGRARKESRVLEVQTFDDFGYRDLLKKTEDPKLAFSTVLQSVARDIGADSIVVEHTFPVLYADALRSGGFALEVKPDLFILERRQKHADEIGAIEQAQRATERAMARAAEIIGASEERVDALHYGGIPLTSERLRSEIETLLIREGMDVSHVSIVAGGPGAADPHWVGFGPLKTGQAVVVDLFPRGRASRYFADMTRTFVKGEVSDTLSAMYDATARALDAALAEIRPGASGRAAHEAAKCVFADAGFDRESGPRYIHGTGHGVGLDIHEAPSLGMLDVELIEGDVVTVEPGLYDPQLGAVRIEDLIVVTGGSYRNLTDFPRRFQL
jgi:Xaa-Pro aminopeptidase